MKKIWVVLIALLFLSTGLSSSVTAFSLQRESYSEKDTNSVSETTIDVDDTNNVETNTITLYRYGPDGSVSPVQIVLTPEETRDRALEDVLTDKCVELLEQDREIQTYVNTTRASVNMIQLNTYPSKKIPVYWCKFLKSEGKGIHIKISPPRIKWLIWISLQMLKIPFIQIWHAMLIRMISRKAGSMIYCRYAHDTNANTTIGLFSKISHRGYNGTHSVLCLGFVGYTTWLLPRSIAGQLIKRSFAGFSLLTYVKTL